MKLIQVYEGRRIQFHALFQVFGLGNLCSRVRNIHISTKLQLKGKPLPVSGLIAQKKEAAASAVFCKNNRFRLVTLFQILSPVHFVYNAVCCCCFCIADSNGRL